MRQPTLARSRGVNLHEASVARLQSAGLATSERFDSLAQLWPFPDSRSRPNFTASAAKASAAVHLALLKALSDAGHRLAPACPDFPDFSPSSGRTTPPRWPSIPRSRAQLSLSSSPARPLHCKRRTDGLLSALRPPDLGLDLSPFGGRRLLLGQAEPSPRANECQSCSADIPNEVRRDVLSSYVSSALTRRSVLLGSSTAC